MEYLTGDLPGTGGDLKRAPGDFRVDEIPAYAPCGNGEHVYMRIRKRGLATFEALRRIANALGIHERFLGYAGLKDARAVTTQWLSASGTTPDAVRALDLPRVEVLEVSRHTNRLRIGHLRGNRFSIVVRDAAPDAHERAARVLDVLVRRGAPNYFGEQRFGTRRNTHTFGEAMLRRDYEGFVRRFLGGDAGSEKDPRLIEARRLFDAGDLERAFEAMPVSHRAEKKCLHALIRFGDPRRACAAIPRRLRQMYVSSYQSFLFNGILARRLAELDVLREGDLAYVHRSAKVFPVQDVAREQTRCRAFEISPSGPIFGTRTTLAGGAPGALEREALAATGLEPGDFALGRGLTFKGQRRPLRIPLKEVALAPVDATSLRVDFVLPSGCFATAVMREVLKT